jgi:hypothetical protein
VLCGSSAACPTAELPQNTLVDLFQSIFTHKDLVYRKTRSWYILVHSTIHLKKWIDTEKSIASRGLSSGSDAFFYELSPLFFPSKFV